MDMEEQTGLKLAKEYVKSVYCQHAGTTYMQAHHEKSGLDKSQTGIKIVGRNINTSDTQMTPPYGRKQRGTEEPLDESKRGE